MTNQLITHGLLDYSLISYVWNATYFSLSRSFFSILAQNRSHTFS